MAGLARVGSRPLALMHRQLTQLVKRRSRWPAVQLACYRLFTDHGVALGGGVPSSEERHAGRFLLALGVRCTESRREGLGFAPGRRERFVKLRHVLVPFRHARCGLPRTDDDEALQAPARRGEHPTVNENRTHLLRPCAATALLNELSLNSSRARSFAANDEAVIAGTQVEGELPGFPHVDRGRIARA